MEGNGREAFIERKKTKVQSKDKTGFYNIDTKDLKAAREEKVKTYLQVSLFSFSAEGEIKPSERCCQGLAAHLPLHLVFFPLLFPHNNTRMQERNSLYLLRFFYSASCVFLLFYAFFSLRFHHPF
jgi:hypothetical protein